MLCSYGGISCHAMCAVVWYYNRTVFEVRVDDVDDDNAVAIDIDLDIVDDIVCHFSGSVST
jgi:hypothetical protein